MADYTRQLEYYEHIMRFLIDWEKEYNKTGNSPAPYENWYFISVGRNYDNTCNEEHHIEIKLRTEYGEDVLETWGKSTNKKTVENIEKFKSIGFMREEDTFTTDILLAFGKIDDNYIIQKIKKINEQFEGANITVFEPKSGGCYVATAVYGSYDCPEVWTLRRFRDKTLAETWYGRLFIRFYYAVSPIAVKYFGQMKWFQNIFRKPLNKFVEILNEKGFEDTPYYDRKEE